MEIYNADELAMDVIEAEGMDGYSHWTNKIAERFMERFGTEEIDKETFVDRIKGIKEGWSN